MRKHSVGKAIVKPLISYLSVVGIIYSGQTQNGDTGLIEGQVVEAGRNIPLPSVIVTVRGTSIGTRTDDQGEYLLPEVPPGVHNLSFTRSGYKRATVTDVKVAVGQRTNADAELAPEYFELETYEVIADPFENQSAALLQDRQFETSFTDSIGSEFFSRAGAGDAAEIMTKVTGASVVGGKYVIIRGLGDRYGNTLLNGLEVPSADPDRKTVQMDIFPSSVIDNIITAKTFTADKPGSFTGGLVDIQTKAFPEEDFVKASVGLGYNPQDNLRDDFLSYSGGGTGRWGSGYGTRDLPDQWIDGDTINRYIADREQIIRRSRSTPQEKQTAMDEIRQAMTQFTGTMGTSRVSSGVDESYALSFGATRLLQERKLGFVGGINYNIGYNMVEAAQQNRYNASASTGVLLPRKVHTETKGEEEVNWSGMGAVSYEVLPNWVVSATGLYVRSVEDEAVFRKGINFQARDLIDYNQILHLTQRDLDTLQIANKITVPDWNDFSSDIKVGFASTSQDEPDFRFIEYSEEERSGDFNIFPAFQIVPTRIFRRLDEQNVNVTFDNDLPFDAFFGDENHFKFGVFYSDADRGFSEHTYTYDSGTNFAEFNDHKNPAEFATDDKIDLATNLFGQTRPSLVMRKSNTALYTGDQRVWAGYLLGDFNFLENWRMITGGRYETTDLSILTDTARGLQETNLNEAHILPSLSFVRSFGDSMNLRLAYGKTIARPTFKEIAGVTIDDFVNNLQFTGNPNLQMTEATNYDIRWEWFPNPGEVIATSLFYKDLSQPIELEQVSANDEVQPKNRESASVYGIELELRKNLEPIWEPLAPFEIGFNYTYVKSEINTTPFEFENFALGETIRPLAGQSPYIANIDLTYRNEDWGTTASLFYNVFGERLYLTSRITPSVYEQPAPSLDFSLSQQLGDRLTIKFSARNLLNPNEDFIIRYNGSDSTFYSRSRGRAFGLSMTYEL